MQMAMVQLLPWLTWLLVSLLAVYLLGLLQHGRRGLPPGPRPLPVIGSLHLLGTLPHRSLARLAETHGRLLSLQLGCVTTVVVSSSDVAREFMQKNDAVFSTRPVPDALRDHARNSVPWLPNSPRWRALRRIMTSELFAPHRLDELQHLRREKVCDLINYVRCLAREGVAIDINRVAFTTSLNLISRTIFSCDVTDLDDRSRSKEFKEVIAEIMEVAGSPNLSDFFPAIATLDVLGRRRRMRTLFERLHAMFNDAIDRRSHGRDNGEPRNNDFLDHLLDATLEGDGAAGLDRDTLLSMFTVTIQVHALIKFVTYIG